MADDFDVIGNHGGRRDLCRNEDSKEGNSSRHTTRLTWGRKTKVTALLFYSLHQQGLKSKEGRLLNNEVFRILTHPPHHKEAQIFTDKTRRGDGTSQEIRHESLPENLYFVDCKERPAQPGHSRNTTDCDWQERILLRAARRYGKRRTRLPYRKAKPLALLLLEYKGRGTEFRCSWQPWRVHGASYLLAGSGGGLNLGLFGLGREHDEARMECERLMRQSVQLKNALSGPPIPIRVEERKDLEPEEEGPKPVLPYSSMFIFSSENPVRLATHWVVNLRYFDFFIMIVISMSSIALAAEDPIEEKSEWNRVLNYFDYAFTGVFTVEMLLKQQANPSRDVVLCPRMAVPLPSLPASPYT
ncbi:unnamed protein product [Cyprideis torosa]|uniref:Uncharacterized protein n=1 Tax=Cyprideis torosa TaxID=163714 RepID=A0A7R8ZLF2_9CRUS|nr:unnamed protein product [Cyprideis torosa]CAG0883530.1 unnamed protein product [Cyprideis torosa]